MKEILNNKDSFIPLKDFIALIGYKRTSAYYQMLKNDKTTSKPIKLLGRKVFLSSQEVNNWIELKKAARG